MAFETFGLKGRHLGSSEPTVTITGRGVLSLNRAARERLGNTAKVLLLFDRQNQVIGIKPCRRSAASGVTVGDSGMINAVSFLKWAGVGHRSMRWPALAVDGVVSIDVSQPGQPVSSNRRGRGAAAGARRSKNP